jgi:hypothetical protein
LEECPVCKNKKIKEVGGEEIAYERSVSTGKVLKREKTGCTIWWKYTCKCGWESETYTH